MGVRKWSSTDGMGHDLRQLDMGAGGCMAEL